MSRARQYPTLDGASSIEPCSLSAEAGASKRKTREYTRNSGGRAPYIVFFGPGYEKMESSQSEASDVMITASPNMNLFLVL